MTTRLLIGYALLVLLVAGSAFGVWWAIHNSERNVHRRKRRARRARRMAAEMPGGEANEDPGQPE
jgi:hypothetical protein